MRVLLACDWFLKYSAAQAVGLVEAGAEVGLVARDHALEFGGDQGERERLLARAASAGVEVMTLPGRLRSLRGSLATVRTRQEVDRWRPDVVHVHENQDPRLAALSRRRPTVLTVHDPRPHPGAASHDLLRRAWTRQRRRAANLVVVHGEALARELSTIDPGISVAVVPPGTDPLGEPRPKPSRPTVALVGRLQAYKGLQVLLEAMPRVWESRPEVRLLVAGEGPEAARLPADERIVARIGYVPEAELDGILSSATLVALPYTQASQSAVGPLAIGLGVPTIVSDTGALPDLAADRSLVVPTGDAQALADAIERHLDHGPELRARVLAHAREHFSWRGVGARTISLYRPLFEA